MKRLLLALTAVLTLAGCGIGSGQVITDGAAPKDGPGRTTGISGPPKRGDLPGIGEVDLVMAFLQSAAASPTDPNARDNLMRSYVTNADWRPTGNLKVVHVLDARPFNNGDGTSTVKVSVQYVGVLDVIGSGTLEPITEDADELSYTVVNSGGQSLLRDPPHELLLSDGGLETYFEPRPLYFWSGSALVPDLRYISQSFSLEQKSNTLVTWLYDGAAAWLQPSVRKLPSETRPTVAKVVRGEGGSLVIDLSAAPPDADYDHLREQLARTLLQAPLTSLTVKVQGQVKSAAYTPPALPVRSALARYVVADGVVRRLRNPGHPNPNPPIPNEINKNVVAAAFSNGEGSFAVAQQDGTAQRLFVGTRTPIAVDLRTRPTHIAQPFWLDHESQSLLVQADKHIYQIGVDGKVEQDTEVPGLQVMSAFYNGRRLALVIDGSLYLVSRNENGAIALSSKQRVPTLFDTVQGVAFGERFQLIVSGTYAGGVRLMRMNLDGSKQILLNETYQGTVSHIVADPELGTALFEVQGRGAFELRQTNPPSLYDSIDWGASAPPPAESRQRISAPSFEG